MKHYFIELECINNLEKLKTFTVTGFHPIEPYMEYSTLEEVQAVADVYLLCREDLGQWLSDAFPQYLYGGYPELVTLSIMEVEYTLDSKQINKIKSTTFNPVDDEDTDWCKFVNSIMSCGCDIESDIQYYLGIRRVIDMLTQKVIVCGITYEISDRLSVVFNIELKLGNNIEGDPIPCKITYNMEKLAKNYESAVKSIIETLERQVLDMVLYCTVPIGE